jgi:allantoate deiminase
MDHELTAQLAAAITATGHSVQRLPSGAGHDAMVIAAVAPVAMLFVRCRGGVSHHPSEWVSEEDLGAAGLVLWHVLEGLRRLGQPSAELVTLPPEAPVISGS